MQYLGGHWGCLNLGRRTGHLEDPSWQKGVSRGSKTRPPISWRVQARARASELLVDRCAFARAYNIQYVK